MVTDAEQNRLYEPLGLPPDEWDSELTMTISQPPQQPR
jgi:hypothetical protein